MNENVFTFVNRYKDNNLCILNEYTSELTKIIDKLSNIPTCSVIKHYVLIDNVDLLNKILVIRIPGCTIGYLKFDKDYNITDIKIETSKYTKNIYNENINYKLKEYIGYKIVIER